MKKQNPTNTITELVFIIDRSGSMSGLESDTIGGFNAMIEKQRKQEGECYVSTVLFDNNIQTLHDRIELPAVSKMTEADYTVGGCTALLDAIGDTIKHIETIHKYVRTEDIPTNTMFIITTDGMENASKKYSSREIKKMIGDKKEKGWEFLFIGANIDAVETASRYGISKDRAVNYNADEKGTRVVYEAVGKAVGGLRRCCALSDDWSQDIEKDYKERSKKAK